MIQKKSNIETLFQNAVESHLQGKFSEALGMYQRIIEINPEHFEALHNIGAIHLRLGDNERAIDIFQQAIRLNKDFPDALNNLATALKNRGEYYEAEKAIHKAISLKEDQGTEPSIYYIRA